ncbi:hypothetical protein CRYUN_Cryun09bG0131900 [Craigia yunnanensis]
MRADSYPLYASGSCPHIDESFHCFINGRPDGGYKKYRWQPNGCIMPRLNGKYMLDLLRGKRVAFVGDSLGRNIWESMDYNCSVEYFRSSFLVQEWQILERNGSKKETLQLDMIDKSCNKYKNADVLSSTQDIGGLMKKLPKGVEDGTPVGNVMVKQNLLQMRRCHPSIYGKRNLTEEERSSPTRIQDWCLPGVPDSWNELVFAQLLIKHNQHRQQHLNEEQQQRRP